ncbi:hypothetical protein BCR42DRAFT_387263 [Absidia repens]|uniref:Uncharacterized protein n=1 Tax=Absidia repens TaxID=90262 RepID=A0A1X2IYR8_9FUNG|nr:hypothetical protein BCR42DRAFT_387263 [Absidia repens]
MISLSFTVLLSLFLILDYRKAAAKDTPANYTRIESIQIFTETPIIPSIHNSRDSGMNAVSSGILILTGCVDIYVQIRKNERCRADKHVGVWTSDGNRGISSGHNMNSHDAVTMGSSVPSSILAAMLVLNWIANGHFHDVGSDKASMEMVDRRKSIRFTRLYNFIPMVCCMGTGTTDGVVRIWGCQIHVSVVADILLVMLDKIHSTRE